MGSLNFDDTAAVRAWLSNQSLRKRGVLGARNLLRVLGNVVHATQEDKERLALACLRTSLLCLCRAVDGSIDSFDAAGRHAADQLRHPFNSPDVADTLSYMAQDLGFLLAYSKARNRNDQTISIISHSLEAVALATDHSTFRIGIPKHPNATKAVKSLEQVLLYEGASTTESLMKTKLWFNVATPEKVLLNNDELHRYFRSNDNWAFWRDWYQQMWDGTFRDWDLAIEVAKLPHDLWEGEDAVGKVARTIEQIKPNPKGKDALPPSVINAQAAALFKNASTIGVMASGLQQFIRMATDAYEREVSNALPEALEPLAMLPDILDRIAFILNSSAPQSQRETELQDTLRLAANTVANLNRRLFYAQQKIGALKDAADAGNPRRLFADAFYKKAGEGAAGLITSKTLWVSIMMGSSVLLGGSAYALVEQLGQCYEGIIAPEAPDVLPRLPHVTEV